MRRKPKGPTARARATKARLDAKVAREIRAIVAARDGYCRYGQLTDDCRGRSQWAHLGEKRRFKTRGLSPAERHTTKDSLMLCAEHHRQYDARKLWIFPLTSAGCDGVVRFTYDYVPGVA